MRFAVAASQASTTASARESGATLRFQSVVTRNFSGNPSAPKATRTAPFRSVASLLSGTAESTSWNIF